MCNHLHTHARTDPTRTLGIRRNFESDLFKRFRKLKGLIREALVKDKALTTNVVAEGAFDFPTSAAKVDAFMMWLREMEQRGDISLRDVPGRGAIDNRWANKYIDTAYKQGQRRARAEMRKQGIDVPEEGAFDQPIHADRVGMIYSRVYSELEGITSAMDQQISRVLAEGITNGDNPLEIARAINNRVDKVGIHRARLLARTEVIRAHHSANVQEYRNAGLVDVQVQAEFVSAGDSRVCPQCAALDGKIFSLDEIERLIPLHPNCRCVATPVIEDN